MAELHICKFKMTIKRESPHPETASIALNFNRMSKTFTIVSTLDRIISNVEVEIAEWHKTTYRPTKRRWSYIVSCWVLIVALYCAILFYFANRTETIISLVIALVVAQFFADRSKSWSTSIGRLVTDTGAEAVPVQVEFTQKDTVTGSDFGAIWLENSVLCFKGLETEFELPYAGQEIAMDGDEPTDWKVKTVLPDRTFEVQIFGTEAMPAVVDTSGKLASMIRRWSATDPDQVHTIRLPLCIRPKDAMRQSRVFVYQVGVGTAGVAIMASNDSIVDPSRLVIKYGGLIAIYLLCMTLNNLLMNDRHKALHDRFPDDPSFSNWFVRFLSPQIR